MAGTKRRYASRWSVDIDQRDEDGFHGNESWLGGTHIHEELRRAVEAIARSIYEDSAGANTRKVVLTIERKRL